MVSIHDAVALETLRGHWRLEPNLLRQLRNAFYKKRQTAVEALRLLPEIPRAAFDGAIRFHALELCGRHDSRLDGASKGADFRGHRYENSVFLLRAFTPAYQRQRT